MDAVTYSVGDERSTAVSIQPDCIGEVGCEARFALDTLRWKLLPARRMGGTKCVGDLVAKSEIAASREDLMHRVQYSGFMLAGGIAMVVLAACSRDRNDEADTILVGGDIALTPSVIRVSDIINNPARYVGDTITVVAEVDDVLSSFAFALDESAMLAGGLDNLLVFSPKSHPLYDLDDRWHNDSVRVTGTVLQTNISDLERALDRDLAPELELRIGTRPVLVAHRVERIASR